MKLPMFLQTLVSMMSRRSAENLEMEEELRAHIAHRADDLERSGASRKDAERRARMEFGSYERFVEECYESRGGHFFESLRQDIRFGLRMLLRSPSFTVAAVLTLALGIGTNAVVFSMLNGFLLRPLNVPQAESLFTIEHGRESSPMHSYPDYLDVRDRNVTLDGVAAYSISRAGV